MWNETNEVFSAGAEWETLLTTSSTDWWNSSLRETVQRLFWLFNEVWLSFDPSDSAPEVFCEHLRCSPIPELIDYSENFFNHIPCNGFLSCCVEGHSTDTTNSSYSEAGIGTKTRSSLQALGTGGDLSQLGQTISPSTAWWTMLQYLPVPTELFTTAG